MGRAAQARSESERPPERESAATWDEPGDDVDRWCVDLGDSMVVLTTDELMTAVAVGEVAPTTLVWRDGHAIWEPVAHFDELLVDAPPSSRTRRRSASVASATVPPVPPRPQLAFPMAFVGGVLLGVIVALPFVLRDRPAPARLSPWVDATGNAAAALVPSHR